MYGCPGQEKLTQRPESAALLPLNEGMNDFIFIRWLDGEKES